MTSTPKPSDEAVELLPCPFCGGQAEIERCGSNRQSTIYACMECGCRLETGEIWNIPAAWNSRAALSASPPAGLDAAAMRERCAPMWAVAVTMTKAIPDGINVQTTLWVDTAQSEEEAKGKAVTCSMEQSPEHQVFTVICQPLRALSTAETEDG